MLETFMLETFAPHQNETFRILFDPPAPEFAMTLEAVTALGAETAGTVADRRVPFSFLFLGPRTFVLPQRMYRVQHEALGTFDIFLVPLGVEANGVRYEAIFT